MKAFNVYIDGKFFDTVYFDKNLSCGDVKEKLEKDGYSKKIRVSVTTLRSN